MISKLIRSTRRRALVGRTWRPQWLPPHVVLNLEATVHPHDPRERAELFLAYNTGTTEIEVLNWLYATVLLLKPRSIIETGAADGFGTIALASGCRANGFGKVHSVEIDSTVAKRAHERAQRAGLTDWIQQHVCDSLSFVASTERTFELGFFDSLCELRAAECSTLMARAKLRGPALFHDTSPLRTLTMTDCPEKSLHDRYRDDLQKLSAEHFGGNYFESELSRGLIALFPKQYSS